MGMDHDEINEQACSEAFEHLGHCLPRAARYVSDLLQAGFRVHPSIGYKLIELRRVLEAYQPRTIREIGCGATTCLFAMWAKRHGTHVIATENDPHWKAICQKQLDELREFVQIEDRELFENETHVGHFAEYSGPAPDLLYIDGPANTGNKICSDAGAFVESGSLPGLIMFDYRYKTVRDFIERFSDRYVIEVGRTGLESQHWYLGAGHHTFARRRQWE